MQGARALQLRRISFFTVTSCLVVLGVILGVAVGPVRFTFGEVVQTLTRPTPGLAQAIIWNLRLPRTILAALVGAALATAGAILKGVLNNPLADPGIIGVSAGAGLSAMTVMMLLPGLTMYVPIAAFGGAFAASLLVYALAWQRGIHPTRVILAGVAVTSLLGAGMSTLMVLYSERVQGVVGWLVGGLSGRGWLQLKLVAPYIVVTLLVSLTQSRTLNVLLLGDEVATSLGVKVGMARLRLTALAAMLAGTAVSVVGLLGFVGLIVPHIANLLVGSDYRYKLPASALLGAALVLIADTIARTAFDPIELPVGVLMAAIGAPFFLYLLRGGLKTR